MTADKTIVLVCTSRTDLDTEYSRIEAAYRQARRRDCFIRLVAPATSLEALIRHLNYHRPHVLHLAGHGDGAGLRLPFEPLDRAGVVDMAGEGERAVSSASLAALLRPYATELRLVVLNACDSCDHARALAQHIEVVIGAAGALACATAHDFAEKLHDALASPLAVGDAFEQARMLTASPHEQFERQPGAGARVLAPPTCDGGDIHYQRITLDIDIRELDAGRKDKIMSLIRDLSGDDGVRYRHIFRGSTKIDIQTTHAGALALASAAAVERLHALTGIPVLAIETLGGDPDLELLRRWRMDDHAAASRLLERNHQRLSRHFAVLVGDAQRAELTARVFARLGAPGLVWRGRDFLALLFWHARAVLHEYLVGLGLEPHRHCAAALGLEPSLEVIDSSDPTLAEGLARLPFDDAQLLECFYWQDLGEATLADAFELPLPTLRARLDAARLALIHALHEDEPHIPAASLEPRARAAGLRDAFGMTRAP